MGSEVYHHLKSVIKAKFGLDATAVGDEGGFAPNILDNKEGLLLITDAIAKAGYTGKIEIGMDVAASEFHKYVSLNDDSDQFMWLRHKGVSKNRNNKNRQNIHLGLLEIYIECFYCFNFMILT